MVNCGYFDSLEFRNSKVQHIYSTMKAFLVRVDIYFQSKFVIIFKVCLKYFDTLKII